MLDALLLVLPPSATTPPLAALAWAERHRRRARPGRARVRRRELFELRLDTLLRLDAAILRHIEAFLDIRELALGCRVPPDQRLDHRQQARHEQAAIEVERAPIGEFVESTA